jgi:serine/threonine protein kinase
MLLKNRYELAERIGRSARSILYRGTDTHTGKAVVIKNTSVSDTTLFLPALTLKHPNIVQVLDYIVENEDCYIISELVEGTDLRRYLKPRGMLDIDTIIPIARGVSAGLGYAHSRGIVHGDLNPRNILIDREGTIKITDFGSRLYRMTLGSIQYISPEQAQDQPASTATDIYSLGIILYELLTGRTPFDGDTPVAVAMQHIQDQPAPPSRFNPGIPSALEEIVMRCLEKLPEMRFQDASELAHALEQSF